MQTDPFFESLQENLRILEERDHAISAQRHTCTEELIRRLCANRQKTPPEEICEKFHALLPHQRPEDFALLCQHLFPIGEATSIIEPNNPLLVPNARATIALVQNPYNQAAYQRFANSIIGAKAYPVSSFSEACEDVYDNRCEFCILPIGNTQEGRLFSFYSMLDRYDLKICAVTEVEAESAIGTVRYALVGKSLPDRIPKHAQWYLQGIIVEPDGTIPTSFLRAARIFDATPVRIDTLPVPYSDTAQRFYFTLHIIKGTEAAIDFYLFKKYERYTILGLYPKLP